MDEKWKSLSLSLPIVDTLPIVNKSLSSDFFIERFSSLYCEQI
jgi:hypothetical protein